ncbi:MAG: hypothetical protein J6Y85_00390 [Alphaproteobacteria bacterium]|nr:hypothetical protein [Alphaproteobacteria bacterium]
MANTLDNILVIYLGKTSNSEPKTVTFKDFIDFEQTKPESLSPQERELQQAMVDLYSLNDREPPLFLKFSNWRPELPLTIDATSFNQYFAEQTAIAAYNPRKNNIVFKHDTNNHNPLMATLAHELKHAELYTKELAEMKDTNNLAMHQTGIINELIAYRFEFCVWMEYCLKHAFSPDKFISSIRGFFKFTDLSVPKWKAIYEEMLKKETTKRPFDYQDILDMNLFPSITLHYKDEYDFIAPIHDTDIGIHHFPKAFRLGREYLPLCIALPRDAKQPANRFIQLLFNGHKEKANALLSQLTNDEKASVINKATTRVFWPPIGFSLETQSDLDTYEKKLQQRWKFLELHRDTPLIQEQIKDFLYKAIAMGMPNLIQDILTSTHKGDKLSKILDHKTVCTIFGLSCLNKEWIKILSDGLALSPTHIALADKQKNVIAEIFLNLQDEKGNYVLTAEDLKDEKDPDHVLAHYHQKHPDDPRFSDSIVRKIIAGKGMKSQKTLPVQSTKASQTPSKNFILFDDQHT